MDPLRTQRVAETMREELSELIRFELADPRVQEVDVTEVHISPDLRHVDVLVGVAPNHPDVSGTLAALEHARHFLRRQLMQRMDLFRMPELRFRPSAELAGNGAWTKLLRRARRGRASQE